MRKNRIKARIGPIFWRSTKASLTMKKSSVGILGDGSPSESKEIPI
jgi:hypothetical protein